MWDHHKIQLVCPYVLVDIKNDLPLKVYYLNLVQYQYIVVPNLLLVPGIKNNLKYYTKDPLILVEQKMFKPKLTRPRYVFGILLNIRKSAQYVTSTKIRIFNLAT